MTVSRSMTSSDWCAACCMASLLPRAATMCQATTEKIRQMTETTKSAEVTRCIPSEVRFMARLPLWGHAVFHQTSGDKHTHEGFIGCAEKHITPNSFAQSQNGH